KPAALFNSPNYSHAVRKGGTPLFISGQVAMDASGRPIHEGDAGAQARAAFEGLRNVVEEAGGSITDIVKLTIFTTDLAYRTAVGEARSAFFAAGEMPGSTFLVISSLADPRYLVE